MSNLACRFIVWGINERHVKLGQRARKGSHGLLLKFQDSLHISVTVGARNVKFGVQIHHEKHLRKNKIMLNGSSSGHVTYF